MKRDGANGVGEGPQIENARAADGDLPDADHVAGSVGQRAVRDRREAGVRIGTGEGEGAAGRFVEAKGTREDRADGATLHLEAAGDMDARTGEPGITDQSAGAVDLTAALKRDNPNSVGEGPQIENPRATDGGVP